MPWRTRDGIPLAISRAEKADVEEILELQYAAYQSEAALLNDYDIQPLKQTIEDIGSEYAASIFLKAVDAQGKIIASVRGRIVGDSLFIGKLIVLPIMQGKGIGTKLLDEIERIADCNRCELFTSSKSLRNIELYKRAGYSIFKEKKISDNVDLLYLQKFKQQQ